MPRLIAASLFIAAFVLMAPLVASAQQGARKGPPNPQKLEKCRELARERGFLGGGRTKGAIKPRDFVIACMQGKVG